MKTIPDLMLEVTNEFSIEMLNEEACRNWFLKKIHPDGVFCPHCHGEVTSEKRRTRFWEMLRTTCPLCSRSFSAVTGTELNGIGIDFRALYLLLFMVNNGAKPINICKQLRISSGAAYVWANKAKASVTGNARSDN